jgi:hypothetical protein
MGIFLDIILDTMGLQIQGRENMAIKEYSRVKLSFDVKVDGVIIPKGTKGTVLESHNNDKYGVLYLVELDSRKFGVPVFTFEENQLEIIS